MLQTIVVGQGSKGEHRWRDLVSVILRLRESGQSYNLNQLCVTLDIPASDLMALVGEGVRETQASLARTKASLLSQEIIDWAHAAAREPEAGFKDREMLLRIGGVLPDKGGVSVNVNQQVGVKIGKDELLAPLRQFSGVAEEIDNSVREIVEGEVVE